MIREKHTKSGRLFEAEFFPVWNDGRRMPARAPKSKRSTTEQARYNKTQAIKKLIRLVNTNFDTGDVIMHPTYEADKAPQSEEQARKNLVNYLRRVKRKRESELKRVSELLKDRPNDKTLQKQQAALSKPFKYIYVIEKQTYKSGKNEGRDNWHYHLFMTGGVDRDTLEDMWPNGIRTNADRFQPEKFGPEAAAKYMSKDPQGSKRFCASRNLDKPKQPKPKDGKITPRGLERISKERVDDREYWERKYKGYRFVRTYARYNEYNGHWYLSVIMYKADSDAELPQWEIEEWLTEQL